MDLVDDTNPTARALRALQILQDQPGITAARLAERLGTTARAARRYVAVLREAGLPIDATRGPYGGYRLGRGVRLPPLLFEAAEALGLVMAVLDGHHAAADIDDPVGSALAKLLRALPAAVAAQAEEMRRTAQATPDRAAARPEPATAMALVQACGERQQVHLGYRTESGREWEVDVDPWAVVVRHGRWYLLCFSHRAEERRAYRLDRIRSVTPLPGTFTPPADLDPVADLESHLGVGWEFDVEVLLHVPLADVRWVPRHLGRLEPADDQTTRLVGSTGNPAYYAEELARLPMRFTVASGSEVRRAVAALGERLREAAGQD